MKFICYPKCTTCQKAKKWLDERGIRYEVRDIKEERPSYDELKTWLTASDLPVRKFFNTSGLVYKSLNLRDKLPAMSEEECLRLLSTDGMLVKRPLLIGEGVVLLGFRETEWEKALREKDSRSA
jgi:arsenate reductase